MSAVICGINQEHDVCNNKYKPVHFFILPKTMKAAVLHEFGGLLITEEMPVKELGGRVVLEIAAP